LCHGFRGMDAPVGHAPDLEVAESDARELGRRCPVVAGQHLLQYAEAVEPEVGAKEAVEQEQLADHVAGVHQLDEQVGAGEVSVVVDVAKRTKD